MRALLVVALFVLAAAACSNATTRLTAEDADPTGVVETQEPTAVPTSAPTAVPSATQVPVPTATSVPDEPTLTDLMPSGANDSEALQEALNNVEAGAELRLAAGRFQIDDTLVVRLDVRIIGAGSDQTILERADDGAIMNVRNVTMSLQDVGFVSTFRTDAENRVPVVEIINSDVDVAGIVIEDSPGTGAWIEDSTGSIVESMFINSGWIGLWVVDSDLTITGNEANRNGDGFFFDGESSPQVSDNTASLNLGAGFWWHAEAGGVAEDNEATKNDLGFLIDGDAVPQLVGNTATGNTEIGFAFRETSAPLVEGNVAIDSTQGFYVDGESMPTLVGNTATNNAEVGIAWYDESAGTATNTTFENNGQQTFVEETASPTIDGEPPATAPDAGAAETPTSAPAEAPGCPSGSTLEAGRCVRVVGSPQSTCSSGTLQNGSCVVQVRANPEQTCAAPYLLYRAESGDPTLPGLDGTCAWFDNSGTCPAGDTYNPSAGNGEIFTHKCKRPPMVTYSCEAGTLVDDVCESRQPPTVTCAAGTPSGNECIELTDPS